MLISKLYLNNIRSYKDQEIVFPSGSVLLSGDIGSGKSTILLAIEFVLFGADADRLSGNALLRKGAIEGFAELTFTVDGKCIMVRRGLKKNKSTVVQTPGSLVVDGMQRDLMPIELKTEIINLLGYPDELVSKRRNLIYRYTIYCPQEEMKLILGDEKEARLDALRRIFGVDRYNRIQENIALVVRETRSKIRELEVRSEGLEKDFGEREGLFLNRDRLAARLVVLEPQLANVDSELLLARKNIEVLEQSIRGLQQDRTRLSSLEEAEKIKSANLRRNEEKLATLPPEQAVPDAVLISKEVEMLEMDVNCGIEKQSTLQQQIKDNTSRATQLQMEIIDYSKEIEKNSSLISELGSELMGKGALLKARNDAEIRLQSLIALVKEFEVKRAHAEEVKQKILSLALCPICLQSVSKEHKERVCEQEQLKSTTYDTKLRDTRLFLRKTQEEHKNFVLNVDYLNEIDRRLAALKAQTIALEEKQKNSDTKKKMQSELNMEKERYLRELAQINVHDVSDKLRELRETLSQARQIEKLYIERLELEHLNEELRSDIKGICEEKDVLLPRLASFGIYDDQLRAMRAKFEEIVQARGNYTVEVAQIMAQKDEIARRIDEFSIIITSKQSHKKNIEDMQRLCHWMGEWMAQLMATIEKHIMINIHREFDELSRRWFSMLISDESMVTRLDDSFHPIIEQNGYEIDVNYLSGGERTSAALAYRLALAKVVNDVIHQIRTKGILILDEPTDGFSSEQLDRVRDVLEQLELHQVIIVSHENKMESFVRHIVKVVKENNISTVV